VQIRFGGPEPGLTFRVGCSLCQRSS
jgi:hypothetical protein